MLSGQSSLAATAPIGTIEFKAVKAHWQPNPHQGTFYLRLIGRPQHPQLLTGNVEFNLLSVDHLIFHAALEALDKMYFELTTLAHHGKCLGNLLLLNFVIEQGTC